MPDSVFERIEALLARQGVEYHVLRHEPVYTSEEAARVRGFHPLRLRSGSVLEALTRLLQLRGSFRG